MVDLINRSDVIQILDENGWLYETNIGDLIKEIPTAYDIDNVVKELKQAGCYKAIDIVKRGIRNEME